MVCMVEYKIIVGFPSKVLNILTKFCPCLTTVCSIFADQPGIIMQICFRKVSPNRRQKASQYSNMPWTHQAIQSPDMECPLASFLPVISSHFQMSVFHWAPPSNNFAPAHS